MTHSEHKRKLDDLLADAVDLRPKPNFAQWQRKHPEAIEALQSLPAVMTKRRFAMARIIRYSTSALAVVLLLVAGAWWMLFSGSVRKSWAQVIDQLAQIRSATCTLRVYERKLRETSRVYLEGSRVRIEGDDYIRILDFDEGKTLWAAPSLKKGMMRDITSDERMVVGSNPLNDLIKMKDAPAEHLPDETVDDTLGRVYRVKTNTFVGFKVPWVKLWLDPQSNLPLQIHAVVADGRMSWTFTEFHWNEPFDEDLLKPVVPEGYEVLSNPYETASAATTDKVEAKVEPLQRDSDEEEGRDIPVEEIANKLDMLGQRIEANYKAITSWSGTYDLVEQRAKRGPPGADEYTRVSHAAVEFFAEPTRDRIRIDYREVEPTVISDPNIHAVPIDARWVRTPEHLLQFSPSNLEQEHHVEGFPRIENDVPGAFRVLYREPPKGAERYMYQGYVDPRSFFGNGSEQPYRTLCSTAAGILRGEHGADNAEYGKKNMAMRERRKGAGAEYVFAQRFKPVESGPTFEWVFSSEVGFNVVSQTIVSQGELRQSQEYTFRAEKGIFLPFEAQHKQYEDSNTPDSAKSPTMHRTFTLKTTRVNEPIDPAVFEPASLGLKEGDRMVDRIENQMLVFDGEQFVPAEKFKLQPAAKTKREDSERAKSISQLKQIALGMLEYESAKKSLPPAYWADKDGKPLLSWRVLILPFIDQNTLYQQFHLDEPWDSEHNKPLIDKIPEVYKSLKIESSHEGKTNYLTVRGDGTAFPGSKGVTIGDIKDGTSSTIMVVEVSDGRAVVWTKPDDFDYDEHDPLKGLVGLWPDGFAVSFVDGSVQFVSSAIDPTVLTPFFVRNSGKVKDRQALGR